MQYEVCLEMLEVGFEDGSAVWCGDVRDECNDVRDGSDGIKIDTWWSEDDELSACFGGVGKEFAGQFFQISPYSPTIRPPLGMYFSATCNQPPGAAHRSITHRDFDRRSYLRLRWMSLLLGERGMHGL